VNVLRLRLQAQHIHMHAAVADQDWQTLPVVLDAQDLSVQAAGGGMHFTGAVIGLHTRQ
jgi:beta-xylosidase